MSRLPVYVNQKPAFVRIMELFDCLRFSRAYLWALRGYWQWSWDSAITFLSSVSILEAWVLLFSGTWILLNLLIFFSSLVIFLRPQYPPFLVFNFLPFKLGNVSHFQDNGKKLKLWFFSFITLTHPSLFFRLGAWYFLRWRHLLSRSPKQLSEPLQVWECPSQHNLSVLCPAFIFNLDYFDIWGQIIFVRG